MKIYTIGVDLGGTNIKAGLVDEAHHIVDSVSCKTNLPRPEHEVEAEIAALCSQLAQRAGLDMAAQIESVGIGTPGSVNPHTGVVVFNLLCAPCFAAIGAIRREMNSAKWTLFAVGYQCVFAYAVSLMIFQFGSAFTGALQPVGLVCAVAVLALLLFMLFRPYKQAKQTV